MEPLEKLGETRKWICNDAVPVVGHETNGVQLHLRLFCGESETVVDQVIGQPCGRE
jgi:hypothetical protein